MTKYFVLFSMVAAFVMPKLAVAQDIGALTPLENVMTYNFDRQLTEDQSGMIVRLRYNPADSNFFFSGSDEGEIQKWEETQQDPIWEITAGEASYFPYEDFNITPDGRFLVAVGANEYIQFFDTESGESVESRFSIGSKNPLPLPVYYMRVAFSPDNKIMAVGDANGFIYLFSMESQGEPVKVLKHGHIPIKQLDFSKNGTHMVGMTSTNIKVWSMDSLEIVDELDDEFEGAPFWAEAMSLPRYERLMVITSYTDNVIYDLASGTIRKRYPILYDNTNPENDPPVPFKTLTNNDLSAIWTIYVDGVIEQIDVDSGDVVEGFYDKSIFAEGGFVVNTYVAMDWKPGSDDEIVVGVMSFRLNFITQEFSIMSRIRKYRLPL